MKRTLSLLAIAAVAAVIPAHAAVYTANFTGIVYQSIGATNQAVGNTVTGSFDLDSVTGNFLDFSIAGKSVAAGFQSFASIGPAMTDAIYTAQVSPLLGGSTNSTFSLDLSSLTMWPSGVTAVALLSNTTQLGSNLDTNASSAFRSTFNYYLANADGTNVSRLGANLTSITTVTAVPEPSSLALLVSSGLLLAGLVRSRRA